MKENLHIAARWRELCDVCDGTGKLHGNKCHLCKGKGKRVVQAFISPAQLLEVLLEETKKQGLQGK